MVSTKVIKHVLCIPLPVDLENGGLNLFWFLIDICISNANILINESPNHELLTKTAPRKRSMLEFRNQLTYELINNYRDGRKCGRTVEPDIHGGGHHPKPAGKKRRCTCCKLINRKPRVRESIFICKGCSDFQRQTFVHLCPEECFEKYRTQRNFGKD